MPIAKERLNSIHWGRELLHQMVADLDLPNALRERAQRIAIEYPPRVMLDLRLRSGSTVGTAKWTVSLLEARHLFDEIKGVTFSTSRTRLLFSWAWENYPDKATIGTMFGPTPQPPSEAIERGRS